MANLICRLIGVRGRVIDIYDNKCEMATELTVGSVLSKNATDGFKTIYYIDCVGIQYKPSFLTIGYLQLETPSMQMNNQSSNFFSENTFTFEDGRNDVTNELMAAVYEYICTRMEGYKYKEQDLLSKDLPAPLARIYGSSKPVSKEEIIRNEEEQELQRLKAENEKKQAHEEYRKEHSEDSFTSIVERCKQYSSAREMAEFLVNSVSSNDPMIEEARKVALQYKDFERIYGTMGESVISKLEKMLLENNI